MGDNRKSVLQMFNEWTISQEFYRMPYVAAMLIIHGSVVIPVYLWAMHLSGDNGAHFILLTVLTFCILISNLAAMPTKITIPIYLACNAVLLPIMGYNLFVILAA